jgi:hypothetical protein
MTFKSLIVNRNIRHSAWLPIAATSNILDAISTAAQASRKSWSVSAIDFESHESASSVAFSKALDKALSR